MIQDDSRLNTLKVFALLVSATGLLDLVSRSQFCVNCGVFAIDLDMICDMNMGVSINGGTPKWMVYRGKSYLEM